MLLFWEDQEGKRDVLTHLFLLFASVLFRAVSFSWLVGGQMCDKGQISPQIDWCGYGFLSESFVCLPFELNPFAFFSVRRRSSVKLEILSGSL